MPTYRLVHTVCGGVAGYVARVDVPLISPFAQFRRTKDGVPEGPPTGNGLKQKCSKCGKVFDGPEITIRREPETEEVAGA